jgi:hypothetical protein
MQLRVLDEDRPGYARLAFDGSLTQPTLRLSVRSSRQRAFLRPDGFWGQLAHFFNASRTEGDSQTTLYEIGPELVNYLPDSDTLEFAAEDGSAHVKATWERASRKVSSSAGGGPEAWIDGKPPRPPDGPAPEAEQFAAGSVAAAIESHGRSAQDIAGRPDDLEMTQVQLSPRRLAKDGPAGTPPPPPPSSQPGRQAPAAGPPPRRRALPALTLGLAALAGAGFLVYLLLPCQWLPQGYCPVDQAEVDAAQKAGVCAFYKSQSGLDCEIAKDCIDPYLASFPKGTSRADLEARAKSSTALCRQMVEKAEATFACIDDLKKRGRSRCDVQVACTQSFQSAYPIGPLRRKIDYAVQQAQVDCECERNPAACGRNTSAQRDEDDAWQLAKRCAASAPACKIENCYKDFYLTRYVSGTHRVEAKSEISLAQEACEKPPQVNPPDGQSNQVPDGESNPVPEGNYWGRTLAACGARTDFSVNANVKGGRISWEHDFRGSKYLWEGTIDASGKVSAKVANAPGLTATGRFTADGEKRIEMRYPQCVSEPVPLEIRGKYQ